MKRPIARPVGAEATGREPAPGEASRRISPPKDLVSSRSVYITAERVLLAGREMTERDWEILNFLSECRLASGRQLVRQFWQTSDRSTALARAGRRALKRLADKRVLDAQPRRIGSRRSGSDGLVTESVGWELACSLGGATVARASKRPVRCTSSTRSP